MALSGGGGSVTAGSSHSSFTAGNSGTGGSARRRWGWERWRCVQTTPTRHNRRYPTRRAPRIRPQRFVPGFNPLPGRHRAVRGNRSDGQQVRTARFPNPGTYVYGPSVTVYCALLVTLTRAGPVVNWHSTTVPCPLPGTSSYTSRNTDSFRLQKQKANFARTSRGGYQREGAEPGIPELLGCGMVSSTTAMVATYPLNVIRTRMQTGGLAGFPSYTSVTQCVRHTLKRDGVAGFYRGIAPSLAQSPARVVHLLRRLRRSEPKRTRGGGVGTWRGGRVLRAMVAPRSASRVPKERFFLQNQSGVEKHQTAKLFMSVNLSVSCFFVVGRFRRNALICSPSLDDLFQSYPRTRTLKPVVYGTRRSCGSMG